VDSTAQYTKRKKNRPGPSKGCRDVGKKSYVKLTVLGRTNDILSFHTALTTSEKKKLGVIHRQTGGKVIS
jgi:hypothetical protein